MRPIDADELEKSLENYSNNRGLVNVFIEFLNVMDEAHTLDVKPVVHGHWIGIDEKSAVCSCCNRNNTLYGDFCKWCGADMRKEQNEVT